MMITMIIIIIKARLVLRAEREARAPHLPDLHRFVAHHMICSGKRYVGKDYVLANVLVNVFIETIFRYTPNLPTNIVPTNIAWLKLSGKSPMDMRIPPL